MRKTKWYQKPIYLLFVLALALPSGLLVVPETAASPDQATFYSNHSDGYLSYSECAFFGRDYLAVQQEPTGLVSANSTELRVGQAYSLDPFLGPCWGVYRGALFFNTSSLPDDATITSATLSLYGLADYSYTDFLITVVDGSVLHEPLQDFDYGYLWSQIVSGGVFDTSGFSTIGYNHIPLNATGMGWISRTGITKFGLRSSRDITATAPGVDEYVEIFAREEGTGRAPKLVVTYTTVPPPPPVGGEAYPVSKMSLLAPWIAVTVVLAGGTIWYVLRRRRAQS